MFESIEIKDDKEFYEFRKIETLIVRITPRENYILDTCLAHFLEFGVNKSAYIRGLIDKDITERLTSGFFDSEQLILKKDDLLLLG